MSLPLVASRESHPRITLKNFWAFGSCLIQRLCFQLDGRTHGARGVDQQRFFRQMSKGHGYLRELSKMQEDNDVSES